LSPEIPDTLLDGNQIEQVFVNLLLNAAQAIDKNGTISVESLMDIARENLIIHFSDDGPGIAAESIDKIFDPFFSTKTGGTGLGLAVSYGIIENHQGGLSVKNLPDKGTRFTIKLPIIKEETTSDA
jgi:signal transduction histidine kinase